MCHDQHLLSTLHEHAATFALRRAECSVKSFEKAVRRVCGRPVMFCTGGIEIAH
jgi:hypothetical protein